MLQLVANIKGDVHLLRFLWRATRGYRLQPWRSPYLRWRMETFWGIPADEITCSLFWSLLWRNRRDVLRYLRWVGKNASS
jgi:hypothetical protein